MLCNWKKTKDGWLCLFCKTTRPLSYKIPPKRNCDKNSVGTCIHRSQNHLRLKDCPTCAGSVKIKVFNCVLYKECTIQQQIDNIKCCASCSDYENPLEKEGNNETHNDNITNFFASTTLNESNKFIATKSTTS